MVELHNIGQVEASNVEVVFPLGGMDATGKATDNPPAFIPIDSENHKWLIASLPPDGHALVSQTLQPVNVASPPPGGFRYNLTVSYSFGYDGGVVRDKADHTVGIDVRSQPGRLDAVVISPPRVKAGEQFEITITLQDIGGKGTDSVPAVNLLTSDFLPLTPPSLVQQCGTAKITAEWLLQDHIQGAGQTWLLTRRTRDPDGVHVSVEQHEAGAAVRHSRSNRRAAPRPRRIDIPRRSSVLTRYGHSGGGAGSIRGVRGAERG